MSTWREYAAEELRDTEDRVVHELRGFADVVVAVVYEPLYCTGNGVAPGACHQWVGPEPCQSGEAGTWCTWYRHTVRGWDFGPQFESLEAAKAWLEERAS